MHVMEAVKLTRQRYMKLYQNSKPEKLKMYLESHKDHARKAKKEYMEQLTCMNVLKELINRAKSNK